MNPKLAVLPILVLVISLSTVGIVHADSSYNETNSAGTTAIQNMPTAQTGVSCTQDDITAAKHGLSNTQKKMADLRTQYYNDWQTIHDSGQYNGTWEQYSREKVLGSSDISQIKSDYQKYSSVLRSCGIGPMHPYYSSSTTCSQDDIMHARQELATTEKQGNDLKFKTYQEFQQDQSSGQFNGTWAQYAQEKFWNLPEIVQLKSTHDKFTSFLKSCFGQQVPPQQSGAPQNSNDVRIPPPPPTDNLNYSSIPSDNLNTIPSDLGLTGSNGIPPADQSQNPVPSISSPTDALGTISYHGIPGWVKGIAGWWAQGKISDDEFVSAIKFLVHQGIIKL